MSCSLRHTFHSSRVLRQRRKGGGSLVLDGMRRRVQQLGDEEDIPRLAHTNQSTARLVRRPSSTHLVRRLLLAVQVDHLNDAHLQQLVHRRDLVEHLQDVLDCLGHRALREEDERIALARRVRLRGEERLDELGRVGDEVLVLPVDRVHGEDGVLAHVRVSVFQARAHGGDERLEQLGVLGDFLQEAERRAPDVFVGVLLE